jgi:hypothetical protein
LNHIVPGVLLGLAAGIVVVALMAPMSFPDKRAALAAAFVNRFSIGFLTANVALPLQPIALGAALGLVLSIPDALVTKAYAPVLIIGTVLGGLCGVGVMVVG